MMQMIYKDSVGEDEIDRKFRRPDLCVEMNHMRDCTCHEAFYLWKKFMIANGFTYLEDAYLGRSEPTIAPGDE